VLSSDLPGVNPATLNGMILYYRLMTKRSGLGDSMELSRVGLSQLDGNEVTRGRLTRSQILIVSESMPSTRSILAIRSLGVGGWVSIYIYVLICWSAVTTQVGQAHVATGATLDLGTNTQPSDPRTQRNTKPRVYRPTPVRPVSTTGEHHRSDRSLLVKLSNFH
jgi:hypothetical protein